MNQGIEPLQAAAKTGRRPAPAPRAAPAPAPQESSPQPDLDLDRLVWDPEYRRAMAARLKHAG